MSATRRRAPRRASDTARPVQPTMTPAQERRWGGGALALIGLGTLIVPGLRDAAWAVFGIGWPAVMAAAVGAGLYLLLARHPSFPKLRGTAGALLAVSGLGLVAAVSGSAGGGVGQAVLAMTGPLGGGWLLALILAAGVVVLLPVNWRGLAMFLLGEVAEHAPQAGRAVVAGARRRLTPVPEMRMASRAAEPATTVALALLADEPAELGSLMDAPAASVAVEQRAVPPQQVDLALEEGWRLPPPSLLAAPEVVVAAPHSDVIATGHVIEAALGQFGVEVEVIDASQAPAVTQYHVRPGPGVSVRQVVTRRADLELALAAAPLRIATIPGISAIGIEVPNKASALVPISQVVAAPEFAAARHTLGVALGLDIAGRPVSADLTRMPHLLIAGATGQGKSVCLNTIICSLLLRLDPKRLRLLMIDPKRVELQGYSGLPHLAVPVIVDPEQATAALAWAVGEMERRYRKLEQQNVRDLASYNALASVESLAYIVVVIDEYADLMMVAGAEAEQLICRIAQKARAVGIHLVIATQRPDRTVITGLIKANIPSRIAFAVGSQVDSRVILDESGAETLLGRGDMLYLPVDAPKARRLQGAFISDREVEALVWHWRDQGDPVYLDGVLTEATRRPAAPEDRRRDEKFGDAARAVVTEGAASVSLVQRKLNVGYSRAGRLVDMLAEHRVVGGYQGSKPREVLMSLADVDELLERLGLEGGSEATREVV